MTDTVFVNTVTLTDEDWFNDVNRLHYTILSDPASLSAVKATILAAPGVIGGTTPAAANFTDVSASAVAGPIVATQAQMEAGTATNKLVSPGRQHHHKSSAKAWGKVTFSAGTPTLEDGYNSTITDSGPGITTISMSAQMSSSAYAAIATVLVSGSSLKYVVTDAYAAGSFIVRTFGDASASAADVNFSFLVFGDMP